MRWIEREGYVLSSGRKLYSCVDDRLGIDCDLEMTYGYDGYVCIGEDMFGETDYSESERREIADYMIGLWNKFAD